MIQRDATDTVLAGLWCRSWLPLKPAMLTAPCGWAVWDGQTATFGKHLQPSPPDAAALAICPEFGAHWHGLQEPTVADLAARGIAALATWAAAGFPIITAADLATRQERCKCCQFWQPQARAGLGRCAHGRCGCTKFKPWLATQTCPAGKWPLQTP